VILGRPNEKVLNALASLEGNPDYEVVRGWLHSSLLDLYVNSTRTRDDVLSRWLQGAAQVVAEMLEHSNNARDAIRRSR
jgi:hypothetical protein